MITELKASQILVFFGAIYGHGVGRQGATYAIPTKDNHLRTMPLSAISIHVITFIQYAAAHTESAFLVTAIGCGLAGYTPKDIAPLFGELDDLPSNVVIPEEFYRVLIGGVR